MAGGQARAVRSALRKMVSGPQLAGLTDRQLLERYALHSDEAAFAALVSRHGAMVLGVCRRVLGDAHDADDAFQATFLALARRAGQARWGESVGGWLHEVAHRAAAKLRRGNRRRSAREARAGAAAGGGEAGGSLRELGEVLDEELRRLPERHRVPLILCYYEGRTRDEAARQLGGSLRTLERRLQEGRDLLRRRLERRGVSPGAALLAAAMPAAGAGASLPAVPAPAAAAQGLSARAVSLAGEVLRAMGALKWKAAASLILTLGAGLGGALLALQPGTPGAPPRPGDPSPAAARDADAAEPLPEGALARLGTERFRFGYSVRSVAFSPDGETLATSGNGWGACLWDARTGRLRRNLYNWNESPAVVFSPDGKMIAAPSTHWGTFLWDARTGERLRLLRGAGLCAAFSPDGKLLAVAGRDRSVQLWDPATDRQLRKFGEFSGDVRDLAFSPDGKLLATAADADGADLRLWDVATGAERHRLVGHKRSVSAVAFSPDGERLASAGTDDLAVRIWDPATGKHLHKVPTPGTHPLSLAFSPGGKRLAVGVGSGRVHLFDTGTWEKVRDWEAHEEWVTSLAFSPDGRTLATGSLMGSDVRLWDPETGEERLAGAGHPTTVLRIAVRPDGRTLVSGDLKKMLLTWDLAAGEVRGRARVPVIARGDAWTLSHDGRLAATGHGRTFLTGLGKPDEAIRIWDAGTGKELRRLGTHPSRVEGLAFSRDGRRLASAGWDNDVRVWDAETGREVCSFRGERPAAAYVHYPLALTSHGTLMAAAFQGKVRVWDVTAGKELRDLDPGFVPEQIDFSPGDRILAVAGGSGRGEIVLYDARSGKELRRLSVRPNSLGAIAFSPDGAMLAVGACWPGDQVRLWEVATGGEVCRFRGVRGGVGSLAFTPDSRTLVSGIGSGAILVWDVTGRRTGAREERERTREPFTTLWRLLGDPDPARAYPALWELADHPDVAVPLLKEHLPPVRAVDREAFARLLADLASPSFPARERATADFPRLGFGVEVALRKVLEDQPDPEVRRRVGQVLDALPERPEWVRARRAVQALEYARTPGAQEALRRLAEGLEGAVLTRGAKAALGRLAP